MENLKLAPIYFIISFHFLLSCTSLKVIREPILERTTVISEPVCFSCLSICREGSANSVMIRGIVENDTSVKKYSLEYYLKNFEVEFPLGVSLGIDGQYYILKKMSTEYSDYVMIGSELNMEVLDKILNSKKISLSYSNRKITNNIDFSAGEQKKFIKNIQKVKESLFSAEKLNIIK